MNNEGVIWIKQPSDNPKKPKYSGELTVEGIHMEFALWDRAEGDNPKGPPLKGSFKVNDKEYYFSLFYNKTKTGAPYIKLGLADRNEVAGKGISHARNTLHQEKTIKATDDFIDDDLPF